MWYFAGIPLVPENHAWFTAVMIFSCLAFIFTLMRLISRGFLQRKLGPDDYLMFLAMGLLIAWLVSVVEQIKLGLGDAIHPDQLEDFLISLWLTIIFYMWCQWLIKLSILAQYFRLFESKRSRKILRWMLAWFLIYGLVNGIAPIFIVLSTFNVINDLMVLTFPIPILIKLQMPLRIRLILILTFTCGLFATIVSTMRFNALVINASGALDQEPILGVQIIIWSGLEIGIAIVCGSVPAVKPLFTVVFPSLNFSIRNSSGVQRIESVNSQPKDSANSSTRSWNPLSTFRKYGQNASILNDTVITRNDIELENQQSGITVHHSVEQASAPASTTNNSNQKAMPWDSPH
ncbi:hypothetical protein F5Y13DRAFT_203877 [Hypoxylon sp. FL1857]|nr:hypothetical protein F5Y13DRAFT_203877 [Hypoxylon sp. FL1857]